MTNREFFNAIVSANINEELTAHAKTELAKLDTKNTKRRTTQTKTQKENETLKTEIFANFSSDTAMTAAQIADTYGISTQKASALLGQLEKSGALTSIEVKVKGKGKVKGYVLAVDPADTGVQALDNELAV